MILHFCAAKQLDQLHWYVPMSSASGIAVPNFGVSWQVHHILVHISVPHSGAIITLWHIYTLLKLDQVVSLRLCHSDED